uniref:Platelet endothelial aggregation receptor 1 n=1 Tax=Anas zonorhyncha TaxID=75864 RepID=A0A8B9TZ76_9AVES
MALRAAALAVHACLLAALQPGDPNVCSYWERVSPPPRPPSSGYCFGRRIAYRTEYRQAVRTDYRRRYQCCQGYYESRDVCVPRCTQECVHGRCVAPERCQCEPGWRGTDCSSGEGGARGGGQTSKNRGAQRAQLGAWSWGVPGNPNLGAVPPSPSLYRCQERCPVGRYGQDCRESCDCAHGGRCFHVDGACLCEAGYQGSRCEEPRCLPGLYGLQCQSRCLCHPHCHPLLGECSCRPGWAGLYCNESCPPGSFGAGCLQSCLCLNGGTCDGTTGRCHCPPGYTVQCDERSWGRDCGHRCACHHGAPCDPLSGVCACPPGFADPQCLQPCPPGTYGQGCHLRCPCHHGAPCNASTGACLCPPGLGVPQPPAHPSPSHRSCDVPCPEGTPCDNHCPCQNGGICHPPGSSTCCSCRPGWAGLYCNESCPPGSFGAGCLQSCLCLNGGTCDGTTGRCHCPPGYTGVETPGDGGGKDTGGGLGGPFWGDIGQPWGGLGGLVVFGGCLGLREVEATLGGPLGFWGLFGVEGGRGNLGGSFGRSGFWGHPLCFQHRCHCSSLCPPDTFGVNCSGHCSCQHAVACSPIDGSCSCKEGWHGPNCSAPCPPGTWGPGCNRSCDCAHGATCSAQSGTCSCSPGWHGPRCHQPCPNGTFGAGCGQRCDCAHADGCDAVTGECHCLPGWTGPQCKRGCPQGFWGRGCGQPCSCRNGASCSPEDGSCTTYPCVSPPFPRIAATPDQPYTIVPTPPLAYSTLGVVVSLVALVALLVAAVAAGLCYRQRQKGKENRHLAVAYTAGRTDTSEGGNGWDTAGAGLLPGPCDGTPPQPPPAEHPQEGLGASASSLASENPYATIKDLPPPLAKTPEGSYMEMKAPVHPGASCPQPPPLLPPESSPGGAEGGRLRAAPAPGPGPATLPERIQSAPRDWPKYHPISAAARPHPYPSTFPIGPAHP